MKPTRVPVRPTNVPARAVGACLAVAMLISCSGGGSSPGPHATPTPTPTPTFIQPGATAYTCPTSDGTSAVARSGSGQMETARRAVLRAPSTQTSTGLLAVTYATALNGTAKTLASARERATGATFVRDFAFVHAGRYIRVVHVDPAQEAVATAQLRAQPGVMSVAPTQKRYRLGVSTSYFPSDPYFNGFLNPLPPNASTYHVPPFEESVNVPGQWDMHVTRLEHAFEYSQNANGSAFVNGNAIGASTVNIAIIDSGEDTLHPELNSKVAYQKCFITSGGAQSVSNFTTDADGHGTDVSGIAAAAFDNGLGFVGSGGRSSLYAYRVYPTPDDSCVPGGASDNQCGADTADIASAIEDAVANNVNVISMSFGGGSCTNGVDDDPVEGPAVQEAIAHNIVVVAAAGNDGTGSVTAPACGASVIAAGASAIDDGQPNGSLHAGGTAGAPLEYVASYSQYGLPAKAVNNPQAWGIVAPGGDPADNGNDNDNLHWIQNIWTSTPLDSNFAGNCTPDYPGTGSVVDCRILIAGTSMATPNVAGAAALILAANATYQSAAKMKMLLCTYADDINDPHEGCGRLDVYRAMAHAVGDSDPGPATF